MAPQPTIKMTVDRFEHSWPGYRALMRSGEVRADLQARATVVAMVAQRRLNSLGRTASHVRLIADTTVGRNRAGGTVIGVPMRLEKRHRILGSAIDAAGR